MTEAALVAGLFLCIAVLIYFFVLAQKKTVEIEQKSKDWERRAFVYKTLIEGRRKTRNFEEARRNASSRRRGDDD